MGKKKLSKAEKKKLENEQAEALRIEMEKIRQQQLEEEMERKIQELQEAKLKLKREKQENYIRRAQLDESCQYYGKIDKAISDLYAERRNAKEWNRYMRCNGLPNAYDPADLRRYMHMWQMEKDSCNQIERNWLLETNERSVLTQDQSILNLTRQHLKEQQLNLGDIYSKRVVEVLGILIEIQDAIFDADLITESIVKDLHQLKYELRQMLSDHIDELSYTILSNIERDMELEGLMIARYLYQSNVFKMQLWTMLDIPQPSLNEKEKQKESKRFTSIDFPALKLNLMLPPSVVLKTSALRGMWLSYDHFSDYCPTFDLPVQIVKNLDVSAAARREWRKRKEIMKCSSIDEALESMENPLETTIVDVDQKYSEIVDEQNKLRREKIGSKALHLKEFEINLRRYRVISGVYELEYLEQPEQSTMLQPNFFLRTSESNVLKRKRFFQYFRMPAPVAPGTRRPPEEAEAEMKWVEKGLSKLTAITIELPEDVIWFEPPMVCRWELLEDTKQSEKIEKKINESLSEQLSDTSNAKSIRNPKIVNDFNLLHIPSGTDLNFIMKEFVIPRIPDGFAIKVTNKFLGKSNQLLTTTKSQSKEESLDKVPHIRTVLETTTSPRPLHSKVIAQRELIFNETTNQRKEDFNRKIEPVYLLSELIRDLNELCNEQEPYVESKLEEIFEFLSNSSAQEVVEEEPEHEPDSYHPWNFPKQEKPETPVVEEESEDSVSYSIDEHAYTFVQQEKGKVIGRWSVRDIHDSKFNEDKLAIQFRSGRLGIFGLAVNWFSNLPFQTWELKPDLKVPGTVLFSLTAAVVSIEIGFNENGIQLNAFQGGQCPIIQDILLKPTTLIKLQCDFKRAGINLFPEEDAFCYVEGTCEKDIVMETHLYQCMAHMALTHGFSWSRWNIMQNSRSAVLLVRELVEHCKLPNHSTLLVTPLKTYLVECTEVSPSFASNPIADMEFYADLYHLNERHSQPLSRAKQSKMESMLRDNISKLLQAIRPLSFC